MKWCLKNCQAQNLVHSRNSANIPSFSFFPLNRWGNEGLGFAFRLFFHSTDTPCVFGPKDVSYPVTLSSRLEFQISVFCFVTGWNWTGRMTSTQTKRKSEHFVLSPVGSILLYHIGFTPCQKKVKQTLKEITLWKTEKMFLYLTNP